MVNVEGVEAAAPFFLSRKKNKMEKTNEKWIYVIIAAVLLSFLACGTPRKAMTEGEVVERLEMYRHVNNF